MKKRGKRNCVFKEPLITPAFRFGKDAPRELLDVEARAQMEQADIWYEKIGKLSANEVRLRSEFEKRLERHVTIAWRLEAVSRWDILGEALRSKDRERILGALPYALETAVRAEAYDNETGNKDAHLRRLRDFENSAWALYQINCRPYTLQI